MDIQWYPGHMAKAKRLLREQIKLIDVILELRDARIPISSGNPDLVELLGQKQRIVVLNKADLAEQEGNKKWQDYFAKEGIPSIALSSHSKETDKLVKMIEQLTNEDDQIRIRKGMNPRAKRIMVVGIPNVGKSTLVNNLAGRKSAKIADKPGVTRGNQWFRVRKDLELLDTPGLLWPKFTNLETGFMLALTGTIKQEIFDQVKVAKKFLELILEKQPGLLTDAYGITDLDESILTINRLEALGKRWGLLKTGGIVDLEKTASRLLLEFRRGKLGRLTLEYPET